MSATHTSPTSVGAASDDEPDGTACESVPACAGISYPTCNAIPTDPPFPHAVERQTNQTPRARCSYIPTPWIEGDFDRLDHS